MESHYWQVELKNGKAFLGKSDKDIAEIIRNYDPDKQECPIRFIHLDNAHRVNQGLDATGQAVKINTPVDNETGIDILVESIETVFQCNKETEETAEGKEPTPKIEVPPLGMRMPDFRGNAKRPK
jgi:hypothetical protein